MRHQKLLSATASLILSLVLAADSRAACWMCSPSLQCFEQSIGARVCVMSTVSCALLLLCPSPGIRIPDQGESGLTAWSLFDAQQPQPTTIDADAGPLALGDEARGPRGNGRGPLAETMLAHGTDFEVKLVDESGRGFALKRREAGGAVQLEILDVLADQPGRILAEGVLRERDRLVTTVHVEGRDRVLVVQAAKLPSRVLPAELARLHNALRTAARSLPQREKPLLKIREL